MRSPPDYRPTAARRSQPVGQEYLKALKEIAGLRGVVDQFFDKVLVMTKEEKLRRNRLGLLYDISQLFLKIADISEIVHEGSLNKAESTL